MIDVVEVKSKRQIKDFLDLPLKLYKGNDCFVPGLYADEKAMFKPNYFYYDQSESKFWIAYKDGVCVGRIQGIIQKAANKKWKQNRLRFTRVDFIDDLEVSKALFKKIEEYAKENNLEEIVGPLGFSDLEREGLLIEGFDQLNTFEEQYNFSYYQKHIENLGFEKEIDWLEHRIFIKEEQATKLINLSDKLLEKGKLHLSPNMKFSKFMKKYKDPFFKLVDETYDHIYGSVPITENVKNNIVKNYAPILNEKYIPVLLNKNEEPVGFGLSFPAFGKILQKSNGHLTLPTIVKLLKEVKHPTSIDLGLVGVTKEASLDGGAIILYGQILKRMLEDKIEYCETNLNLENNNDIISTWSHFDHIQHKRRRSYVKKVNNELQDC